MVCGPRSPSAFGKSALRRALDMERSFVDSSCRRMMMLAASLARKGRGGDCQANDRHRRSGRHCGEKIFASVHQSCPFDLQVMALM